MNDTCCAHSGVVLKHHDYPDGTRSDYWECSSGCGAIFVPEQTDQAGRRLRDWFAGMALQGLIRHPDAIGESEDVIAAWAYKAADAMLEARNNPVQK